MTTKVHARRPRSRRWSMPAWMKPYRALLADYGLGIEDLMNDRESTFFNNEYRAAVIVGLKDQIGLLTRLNEAGMLAGSPGRTGGEGTDNG